jgi:hypothetical protein
MPAFQQAQSLFQDPEQAVLQRKMAEAQALRDAGGKMDMGEGYRGGKVFIVGNALAPLAQAFGGAYLGNQAEQEHRALMDKRQQQESDWLAQLQKASSPTEQKPQWSEAQMNAEADNWGSDEMQGAPKEVAISPEQQVQNMMGVMGSAPQYSPLAQSVRNATVGHVVSRPFEEMKEAATLKQARAKALVDAGLISHYETDAHGNVTGFNKLGQRVDLGSGGKAEKPPAGVQEYEYAKANDGFKGTFTEWLKNKSQAIHVTTDGSGGTSSVVLTPEGQRVQDELAMAGELPSFGMGKVGMTQRNEFLNREGKKRYGEGGTGESAAVDRASAKADKGALNAVTKDLAAIKPFAEMLDKNVVIAKNLAQQVIASDTRLANKPLNWLRQNAADYPQTAEFLAQVRFVQTEAARVLNNPRLVGQLTDSARREMEAVVNGDMPLNSFNAVMDRIVSDSGNRISSMVDQQQRLKTSIGGEKGNAPKPSNFPKTIASTAKTPAEVRALYRSGKLTKEEANAQIEALGGVK